MLDYCLDIAPDSEWLMVPESEAARNFPFYMTELGDFRAGDRYYVERDSREGYQLIYTVEGEGIFQTAEQNFRLTPGSFLVIHCSERHRYAAESGGWHNRWIHFGGVGAEAYAEHINTVVAGSTRYSPGILSRPERIEEDFRRLTALAGESGLEAAARISNHLSNLMTLLLSCCLKPETDGGMGLSRREDVSNAAAYIRENFQRPLTLDLLARQARLSKYHFVRLFKKHLGETPYEYLTGCRINRAKFLLRSTGDSLDEIAEAVGYMSKSNFIAQFKGQTGTTPAKYRQESLALIPRDEQLRP